MKPRVFVVQEPPQVPRMTGGMRPKIDLPATAGRYGTLVYLLEWSEVKDLAPGEMFARLTERLASFTSADYLLAMGHPAAMTLAAVIALSLTQGTGEMKLMWWEQKQRGYIVCPLSWETLMRNGGVGR